MNHPQLITLFLLLFFLHSRIPNSAAQQAYVENYQLNCSANFTATNGYICNNPNVTSCQAYVTFRSSPPFYSTPPNIAFLLGSDPSAIARLNNLSSDVGPVPSGRLLVVPVSCACSKSQSQSQRQSQSQGYYRHSVNYTIKVKGETYFSTANNTYQGLTTCQAMAAQNKFDALSLVPGETLDVPIMCACPTKEQERNYGAKYLVSYIVTWGDDVSHIAEMFGVDMQSVLDANELKVDDVIYPFTPILVPVKTEPINLSISLSSPAPSSPGPPAPFGPTSKSLGGNSRKWVYVGASIGGGVLVIGLCSFFAWFCCLRSKKPVSKLLPKKDTESSAEFTAVSEPVSYTASTATQQTPNTKSWSVDLDFKGAIGSSLKVYRFAELEKATGKFSEGNRIKGSVYRGEFNGDDAAVKIIKGNVQNDEIALLKHINHANIIRLSGYCVNEGNTYLVYEFADQGSLDDWLFAQQQNDGLQQDHDHGVLGWKQRVQIACNVADALNYLHSYVSPPYIHKNMKSSNVLLDSNYRAKITNFGLARTIQDEDEGGGVVHLTKHVVGTHGYLAPEYIENGVVTPKLDVFAFGVVLLELLSGKPAVKPNNNKGGGGGVDDLLFLIIRKVFEGEDIREKLMGFMDNKLGKEYPLDLAYSMAQLAYKCVDRDMNSRPSMNEVSMTLSKIYSSSLDWDPSDELVNSSSLSYSR